MTPPRCYHDMEASALRIPQGAPIALADGGAGAGEERAVDIDSYQANARRHILGCMHFRAAIR
jgi:hypothetical protein